MKSIRLIGNQKVKIIQFSGSIKNKAKIWFRMLKIWEGGASRGGGPDELFWKFQNPFNHTKKYFWKDPKNPGSEGPPNPPRSRAHRFRIESNIFSLFQNYFINLEKRFLKLIWNSLKNPSNSKRPKHGQKPAFLKNPYLSIFKQIQEILFINHKL